MATPRPNPLVTTPEAAPELFCSTLAITESMPNAFQPDSAPAKIAPIHRAPSPNIDAAHKSKAPMSAMNANNNMELPDGEHVGQNEGKPNERETPRLRTPKRRLPRPPRISLSRYERRAEDT